MAMSSFALSKCCCSGIKRDADNIEDIYFIKYDSNKEKSQ